MQYALFYIDFFVNNIQKNHHLTALNGDFIIVCVTFLIMPFIGLSPFLPNTDNAKEDLLNRVNALYRAFSISTDPETDSRNGKECVNALYRAFSISTMKCVNILEKEECVNALYRAFSISTLPSGNALK